MIMKDLGIIRAKVDWPDYKEIPKLKMIIRRLFNSSLGLAKASINLCIHRTLYQFSNNSPATLDDKKQLLNQTLRQLNMLNQSSIFMGEEDQLELRKKRSLTQQEKLKLGLYIPKMALNPRMALHSQLAYRPQLCQNLYQLQSTHLPTKVRILQQQTQSQHFNIDKYINTVYKDVYARYLVNKGIGIEWKGTYSAYGVLNATALSPPPTSLIKNFIDANLSSLEKVSSIAPYSYLTQAFVPTDLIEVQNIRKIGYYVKLPLVQFGKYEKNFLKLKERGSKLELLVFCQFLQKLINPHCLCLTPGSKMIILKRQFLQNNNLNQEINEQFAQKIVQKGLRYEYLVTSLDIFNKHKEYFTGKKYEKHLIFDSDHLVGMKAQYSLNLDQTDKSNTINLGIMSQIEGYERDSGVYIVNASTSIPDYERVQQFKEQGAELDQLTNVLDKCGKLVLSHMVKQNSQNNTHSNSHENNYSKNDVSISIIDIEFQQKLLSALKQQLNFEELYDVFQDQVYSNKQTKQVLRFRLFDKYQVPIRPESYRILQDYFSSHTHEIILHESKVKLPHIKKFNKPRERRLHKKNVRQALKQRTEYMTLLDSINSISNIPISGSTQGDFKMYLEINQEGTITQIYDHLNQIQPNSNNKIEEITISSDLISAISFLYNTEHSQDINSVIIEPQTFTEQILPLCLHLTLLKTKQQPTKRGRKTSKSQPSITKKLLQSLKMIYLHPTLKPDQRDIDVHNFITGSLKISNQQDYGFGFEAIRLWVCRHSDYLGDRQLKEREVNEELKNCTFIRKLYAEVIPLCPKSEFSQSLNQIQFDQLNFLDRFMHEQIDAYVLNMEHFYSRIMLKEAYEYTIDFFRNVVDQIFLSTARHHIITYPNHQDNLSHGVTVRRLIQLLSVIAPLFPFSSYHISKTNIMKWPQIKNSDTFYKSLLEYNALIKIRTEVRNKIELNKFSHCEMVFPVSDTISYSQEDLRKFFGVDKISFVEPQVREKKFGLKLRFNQTLGGKGKISVHQSNEHCIRCDPDSKQKEHLCLTCTEYLQKNVGQGIEFYDRRHMTLIDKGASVEKQIEKESL